ncbi:DUF5659 domain-containing protein [Clostridium botulinum]|uniref:DUF5659 domain-containing protein n=1 Tax=Clostridium botulinum TaxID=1491 RepID=UPI001E46AB45|nr:DUF5659 domain-containing protein [Clostridium botulinum]MCD3275575.1 hypothetical protein [Clostridium botulinum C/D]MCD3286499.1 hypothetical protein [Clostridium botulinum C/D]MCD3291468.1 hypothetical protein [Clostridium botulinum C/D]MCD3303818.1 hypothetical protein [Clostridium botulinum C/D]
MSNNKESKVVVTDKTQLIYLTSKGIKPNDVNRVGNQVQVTYNYDEYFKKANLDFMTDNQFKDYRMAEKTVEQLLRTTI